MEFVLSELCEQVVTARAAQRPLLIRGGGTRLFYGGPLPSEDAASWLELSAYRGVVGYEPSELVLTARAGTPLAEIEALLASREQMLAFEPPRFGAAGTLGGCVASGLSGPRRMAAGSLADFVLGTRLLSADGNVLCFGGEVMKNVAGYDVSRLLAGSLGVLGALVEISLKVAPRPHREATRVLALDESAALERCLRWRSRPLPVSATAWMADASGASGKLWVRLSGNASAVRQGLEDIGGESLDDEAADAFWLGLRDQTHPFFRQRPLWRIVLPAGAPALGLAPVLHEWGGCLRWLAGPYDAAALRDRVQSLGGSACLYRREGAPAGVPTFHPLADGVLQIHRRLKREFDPAGIFNAHRLYPEL
ncbi:glycolate oxidase subunit GlcE [Castellaniella defragrans]|uniref:glycolate oxidase subunit GlcE n=1 Tax=Castellaniella defragrans TaxID=75697 RepID=UPI0023F0B3ED|nr:glycolate oxidase subunit GlcE [Castellaniella defragrans]